MKNNPVIRVTLSAYSRVQYSFENLISQRLSKIVAIEHFRFLPSSRTVITWFIYQAVNSRFQGGDFITKVRTGDRVGREAGADPIFEALNSLRGAREAHAAAVRELDGALIFSGEALTKAMIAWRVYLLADLKAAEAEAAEALHEAKKAVLKTPPTTVAGSVAMLAFLQSYLGAEPDMGLAITAIGHVATALASNR